MSDDQTPPIESTAPVAEAPETSTAQMPANEPLSEPIEMPEIVETKAENPPPAAPSASPTLTPPTPSQGSRELLAKANTKKKQNIEAKLEKIMSALSQGSLSNDDVQKLVRCSDATATRYLSTLVKQGKIRKEGTTGAHVVYVKT